MFIAAISLRRAKERFKHIVNHLSRLNLSHHLIEAVDGRELTDADREKYCDIDKVNKIRWWLTDGAIGCALSHRKALEMFLKTEEKACLILEDDVILPNDISILLKEIESEIKPGELILIYYTSHEPTPLSTLDTSPLSIGKLHYPVENKITIMSATAYIVGRKAAEGLIKKNNPITVPADCWSYFYENEAFDSLRVLYPRITDTKNFKSSIDYYSPNSLKGVLLNFVNTVKFPGMYQFIKYLRSQRSKKMKDNFHLSNSKSQFKAGEI
jgi:glycosyl transferase, family 25